MHRDKVLHKRIGKLLLERGIISEEQLNEALELQKKQQQEQGRWRLIGEILVERGYATEEEIITSVTTQYAVPFLPIESYGIDEELIKSVPADIVQKHVFLPIDKMGSLITITIAEIPDAETISDIEQALGCNVEIFVSSPTELRRAIEKYYGEK
ncbi:MAG: hypothetical protein JW869_07010 [Candidatus Omnitrophica bacterium]|nr:hypothetical protein [Candidatus Omnitrophota bacterium]